MRCVAFWIGGMGCHKLMDSKSVKSAFYESGQIPQLLLGGDKTRMNWAYLDNGSLQGVVEAVQKIQKSHGDA